jgi:hypothetical protein
MIRKFSPAVLLLSFVCIQLRAQPRVDARNTYERVMAVVPVMVGAGNRPLPPCAPPGVLLGAPGDDLRAVFIAVT